MNSVESMVTIQLNPTVMMMRTCQTNLQIKEVKVEISPLHNRNGRKMLEEEFTMLSMYSMQQEY
jgi:hypothetical protein